MDNLLQLYYGDLKIIKSSKSVYILSLGSSKDAVYIKSDIAVLTSKDSHCFVYFNEHYRELLPSIYVLAGFADSVYKEMKEKHGNEKFIENDYYGWRLDWNLFELVS